MQLHSTGDRCGGWVTRSTAVGVAGFVFLWMVSVPGCTERTSHSARDAGDTVDSSVTVDADSAHEAGAPRGVDASQVGTAVTDAGAGTDADASGDTGVFGDADAATDASADAAVDSGLCDGGTCACTPGSVLCDGDRLTTCDALGGGPLPTGGTDCTVSHARCVHGQCMPVICHGEHTCMDGSVYRCADKGTAWVLFLPCDAQTEACEEAGGDASCVFACTPNQAVCDGDVLTTCENDGRSLAPGGVDCTLSSEVCDPVSATCAPQICEPHTTYCKNGNVYQCVRAGADETVFQTCMAGEFCSQDATSAYCLRDVCTPGGILACTNGGVVTVCKADGSGPDPVEIDCSALDEICGSNGCWRCGTEQYRSGNTCLDDVCPQGQATCGQNRITTCAVDGSGFPAGGTDCAATNLVCDASLQCASEALDTLGTPSSCASPQTVANSAELYQATSDRHLTQIEMYFGLIGAGSVTWFVYESKDRINFSQIFQLTVPASGNGSLVLMDSGTISVPLAAGNRYLIGVSSPQGFTLCAAEDDQGILMTSFGRHWSHEDVYNFGAHGILAYPTLPAQHMFQSLVTRP